jgi:hypothetical protein
MYSIVRRAAELIGKLFRIPQGLKPRVEFKTVRAEARTFRYWTMAMLEVELILIVFVGTNGMTSG